jgi:autotransporter-associated beta strand protein
MKPSHHLPLLVVLAFGHAASAQDIIKAQNSTALNNPASWVGGVVPGTANTAVWDAASTTSTHKSAALGADLTWQGVRIDGGYTGTTATYTLVGGNTLTLGSAGIGIAVLSLEFQHPVTFNADATLTLNTDSRGITFNGLTDLGGHTLTVVSNKNTRFLAGSGGFSNGTLLFTSDPHNGQSQFNAASTGNLTLQGTGSAQIIVDNPIVSNPQLDIELANNSRLVLGRTLDNQALAIGNLTGGPGSRILPDFNVTSGNPIVVRTLVVNPTTDGTFEGAILNSNNNRFLGFTKSGAGTLSLTQPYHIYSGPTTVDAGTLKITGEGALCHRPANNIPLTVGLHLGSLIINSGIFHYDSSISQTITGTLGGSGTLLKTNDSFLTLSGDGSGFSGPITVDAGRLVLQNALGGNVFLATGTSLAGSGASTGSLTTAADTTLVLGGGASTTARAFNGVTLNGPTYFEFLSAPQGGTVYDVLGYGAAGITNPIHLTPRARGVLTHDAASSKYVFTAEAAGVRTWNIGYGIWNNEGLLPNWSGGDQVYMQGDQVIFDAISADTTITLAGLLSPSNVTVENPANTYSFVGTGGFTGAGTIHKNASGVIEIGTPNENFQGTLNINAGIFRIIEGGTWGLAPINNNAALELDVPTDSTFPGLVAGTGTLTKRGPGTVTVGGGPNDLLSTSVVYNNLKVNENSFTGDVVIEGGRLRLNKPSALGTSIDGAKTVAVMDGAQLDINGFASTGRDNYRRDRTYSYQIAGAGNDGTGALVNHRGDLGSFAGVLNLELTADATIGGTAEFGIAYYFLGNSTPALNGVITGNGHTLTKTGTNPIRLRGPASNLTIVVQEGTIWGDGSPDCLGGASGSVTVHTGATLKIRGAIFNPVSQPGPMTIATPITFHAGANLRSDETGAVTWAGPITLDGLVDVYLENSDHNITGPVSGSGGIVKSGPDILTLASSNTYTGPTTVSEGTVIIQQPYLANTSAVTVASGAVLNLAFTGTDVVGALTLGGVVMGPGVYNATTHPLLLAGTGALKVVDPDDYANWSGSSGFNLNGGPNDDDDFDGLSNFEEYAFGLNPTNPASLSPIAPPDRSAGTFTYTRRKSSLAALSYAYESSTTLDAWDSFTPPVPDSTDDGNPVETITVTIPAALLTEPGLYLRVKAAP